MTNFNSVKKFMEVFGQEVKTKVEFPSDKIVKLRYDLIKEELDEFEQALKEKNLNLQMIWLMIFIKAVSYTHLTLPTTPYV